MRNKRQGKWKGQSCSYRCGTPALRMIEYADKLVFTLVYATFEVFLTEKISEMQRLEQHVFRLLPRLTGQAFLDTLQILYEQNLN